MYTKISKPAGRNSASCKGLVEYLSKDENTYFTNREGRMVTPETVQNSIDKNVMKLTKTDDKYYMLTFAPSEHELKQMIGRKVSSFDELKDIEKEKLLKNMNSFTRKAMDKYALAFNRPYVQSSKDLLYFSRIETSREHSHTDKEVKNGLAKVGDLKQGLNLHVHVIVSRKSANGKIKLSPNMRFRNKTFEQGDKKVTRGFDYNKFTADCHEQFKSQFNINYENNFDYTREKSISDKGIQAVQGKAIGQIKGQAMSALTQGEFSIERKMFANVNQGVRAVKTVANIAKFTNPATAALEVGKQIVKSVQQLQQIAQTLMK